MDDFAFAPIVSITMTDQVEEKLREYFKQKNIQVGDALPKEIELVEALGVSRSVVREALSRLRMLGMIDTRKRRGMVLTEPDIFSGFERLMEPHFLAQDTMKELFKIRLMLEMGLGDFLFQHITPTDFERLDTILAAERVAASRAELIQLDIQFHSELYRITGNATLMRFQTMLLPLFKYIVDYYAHLEKTVGTASISHSNLVEVLRGGNPEQFRNAMKKHFEPHFNIID